MRTYSLRCREARNASFAGLSESQCTAGVVSTLNRTIAAISSHIEALGGHMAELVVSLETISMPLVLGLSHESLDRMSGAACFPTLN